MLNASRLEPVTKVTIMEEHGIVPDAIDGVPPEEVQVIFTDDNGHYVPLSPGDEVTPLQAVHEPTVIWPASSDSLYTVALIDLDAPSRENPTMRAILHWMVANVPGRYTRLGDVICEYSGPKPPLQGGKHRYAVLVYLQPKKLDTNTITKITTENIDKPEGQAPRQHFSIREFTKKQNFEPVGGTFFFSEYDDYSISFWTKFKAK